MLRAVHKYTLTRWSRTSRPHALPRASSMGICLAYPEATTALVH